VTISSVVTGGPKHGSGLSTGGFVVAFLAVGIVGAVIIDQAVKVGSSSGPSRTIAVEVWTIGNKERGSFSLSNCHRAGRISMLAHRSSTGYWLARQMDSCELFAFL